METIPVSDNPRADLNIETRIRRPPNAFMLFGQQYRKILAQKFGNLSNKQISKILGDEWKKMDSDTKNHYHSLAKEVYQTHLQKYPDYHYNPLEARQRKAERKRKYKTSRVSHKTRANSHFILPVIKPFGGNRSISLPNTTFNFIQTPTVQYVQPILNRGTGDSVIGIKRLSQPFITSEAITREVVPIEHKEHNYAVQSRCEQPFSQIITYENNLEPQINETVVQTQQTNKEIDWNQSFDYLVNFLPPMLNPNTEVTPIFYDFGLSSDENSNQQIHGIKPEYEIPEEVVEHHNQIHRIKQEFETCEEEAIYNEPMDLITFIKKEIVDEEIDQLFNKDAKVVVERIPQ